MKSWRNGFEANKITPRLNKGKENQPNKKTRLQSISLFPKHKIHHPHI